MSSPCSIGSDRARPITVGITGHRMNRLTPDDADAIHVKIRAVLATLASYTDPTLSVVSPLADGADQIAGNVAMRAGYRLFVPLPFSRVDTEGQLPSETDRALFRTLLDYAERVTEHTGSTATLASRESAFLTVGRITVDQSDVLLAVWDGKSARGTGGTAEVVADAQARTKPVIWIQVDSPHQVTLIDPRNRLESDLARAIELLTLSAHQEM